MAIAWHWNDFFFGIAKCDSLNSGAFHKNHTPYALKHVSQFSSHQTSKKKKKTECWLTNRIRNSCQELEIFPNCTFPVLNSALRFVDSVLRDCRRRRTTSTINVLHWRCCCVVSHCNEELGESLKACEN